MTRQCERCGQVQAYFTCTKCLVLLVDRTEEAKRLALDPREAAMNAWDGEREVPVV